MEFCVEQCLSCIAGHKIGHTNFNKLAATTKELMVLFCLRGETLGVAGALVAAVGDVSCSRIIRRVRAVL